MRPHCGVPRPRGRGVPDSGGAHIAGFSRMKSPKCGSCRALVPVRVRRLLRHRQDRIKRVARPVADHQQSFAFQIPYRGVGGLQREVGRVGQIPDRHRLVAGLGVTHGGQDEVANLGAAGVEAAAAARCKITVCICCKWFSGVILSNVLVLQRLALPSSPSVRWLSLCSRI